MNYSEPFARACIETIAAPVVVHPVIDQSHGEHDFDLVLPDGRVGAAEVASVVDVETLQLHEAVLKQETIPASMSKGDWFVTPERGANVKRLRKSLDRYLADVEADGVTEFYAGVQNWQFASVRSICEDLAVQAAGKVRFDQPGLIWIGLSGSGCSIGPETVIEAVREAATRPDNIRKLSRPEHAERHLFVYLHSTTDAHVCMWLLLKRLPGLEIPRLEVDPHVTHLWVGTHNGPELAIVWRADNGGAWQTATVPLPPDLYGEGAA